MFRKPCLTCGKLGEPGVAYCVEHEAERRRKINWTKNQRTLYKSPEYRRARQHIKDTATHCHLCGQAFTNRNEITADHILAGDPTSPLAPAHRTCNSSRGNKPIT